MESEVVDSREAMKIQLAREIAESESHMKSLETSSRGDPDNLELALEVATVYANLSEKYSARAVLDSKDGRMTSASEDAIKEAMRFLDDAKLEIGDKIDLSNYDSERADAIRAMGFSGLESKFAKFESSQKRAKESIDMAVSSVKSLDTQLDFKTLSLTDEQSYMLAAAIEKSAKLAASDTNYGFGFIGTGREEEVEIRYRRKPEYLGMLMLKKEKAEEFLEQAMTEGDTVRKISLKMFLNRLQGSIEMVNSYPDNTLIKVPEEEIEKVTIKVGSDLDRQYWLFADWLLRKSETRRVSPAVREAYEKIRSSVLVSPPSLLLHHEIYEELKREIPLLGAFDNPEYFQRFLGIATERGGRKKIYNLLAGRELEDPISMRLNHAAQKVEGFFGLPSRGIENP